MSIFFVFVFTHVFSKMQRKIFWRSLFCAGVERRKVTVVQFTIYPKISWHFKFHSCFFRYKLSHWWDSIMMLLCNYACSRLLQELGNTVWEDWRTVEKIYAFLKSWGWGHISAGRVLYIEHKDLDLVLGIHVKSQVWRCLFVMPTLRKQRQGDPGALLIASLA